MSTICKHALANNKDKILSFLLLRKWYQMNWFDLKHKISPGEFSIHQKIHFNSFLRNYHRHSSLFRNILNLTMLLYNYGIIFFILIIFRYVLSFSLVGLWTIRQLVQVHRHWVHFTLLRRGYDNHNCHNKPQIGIVTGLWMTSCPEAMGWEFGYFEKHVSWVLDCRRVELVVYWGPVQLSFTVD